jgi:dTDP-4-dehydrorhamnose reductase
MVIAVTGASGQVGQAIASVAWQFPQAVIHYFSSQAADITDYQNLFSALESLNPDFCINAAAYTAVDKAEIEQEKAFLINETGARNLAQVCKKLDCILIHISTDFVFDGTKTTPYQEDDAPAPTGIYGLSKLKGEEAIVASGCKFFIIRTSWIYSEFGHNFMKTMIRLGREKDRLTVVEDQIGTPTHAKDLAAALLHIALSRSQQFGIYHFSNEGQTSWFGFAQKILERHNITTPIDPVPTTSFPTPAKRPAYSVLDKTKIKKEFGLDIRHWEECL